MGRRRLSVFALFLGVVVVGGAPAVFAADPPQLTRITVINQLNDGVQAGAPLRFRLAGVGTRCVAEVQITEVGSRVPIATQTFDVAFGQENATAVFMPPYGRATQGPMQKDFNVRAEGKNGCRGTAVATAHAICMTSCAPNPNVRPPAEDNRPDPPRIVINPNVIRPAGSSSTAPAPTPSAPPKPSGTPGAPSPPSPPSIPGAKPATGTLATLLVPGGSFAEDEAQKLQVKGTGGCGLDLHITNKSYGGSFDKTWNVNPMNLANAPTLYNGTHFDTLAEGSYHADAIGKNGCTGTVQTDFKVTAKNTNATVKGQPEVKLDKPPKSGAAFSKSKDSNIWFKVSVPTSFKDTPYVTCCEVEYDFINQYGGWEVLPSSPFSEPGLNPLQNNNQPAFRSVSYFTVPGEGATKWRMRVRGSKYKTAFEWSNWLEFQVDQN